MRCPYGTPYNTLGVPSEYPTIAYAGEYPIEYHTPRYPVRTQPAHAVVRCAALRCAARPHRNRAEHMTDRRAAREPRTVRRRVPREHAIYVSTP